MAARTGKESLQKQACCSPTMSFATVHARKEHPKNRSNVNLNQERKHCPLEGGRQAGRPCCYAPSVAAQYGVRLQMKPLLFCQNAEEKMKLNIACDCAQPNKSGI